MKKGEIIIFPTDTVYGMGCKLYDEEGLKKIFEVKKRPINKQIPVLVADIVSINQFAIYNSRDLKIMTRFWPGALTVILKTSKSFYDITGEKTIAVRIPAHYLAQKILKETGPMRVTSANISGDAPINDPILIKELFSDKVDKLYLEDSGEYTNIASTIIDLTEEKIKVLREGSISIEEILESMK